MDWKEHTWLAGGNALNSSCARSSLQPSASHRSSLSLTLHSECISLCRKFVNWIKLSHPTPLKPFSAKPKGNRFASRKPWEAIWLYWRCLQEWRREFHVTAHHPANLPKTHHGRCLSHTSFVPTKNSSRNLLSHAQASSPHPNSTHLLLDILGHYFVNQSSEFLASFLPTQHLIVTSQALAQNNH